MLVPVPFLPVFLLTVGDAFGPEMVRADEDPEDLNEVHYCAPSGHVSGVEVVVTMQVGGHVTQPCRSNRFDELSKFQGTRELAH